MIFIATLFLLSLGLGTGPESATLSWGEEAGDGRPLPGAGLVFAAPSEGVELCVLVLSEEVGLDLATFSKEDEPDLAIFSDEMFSFVEIFSADLKISSTEEELDLVELSDWMLPDLATPLGEEFPSIFGGDWSISWSLVVLCNCIALCTCSASIKE